MANSIREQIIQAAITAIDAAVVGITVYRSREAALAAAQLPAVVISPFNDSPSERGTSLCWLDWTFTLAVDILAGDALDATADPTLCLVHAAIMGQNRTLGLSAVHDVMPSLVEFSASNREQPVGLVRCAYVIRYRTSHNDLTTAP